ncbi:hypothetical protein ACLMJK_004722 [Lecanora helva]
MASHLLRQSRPILHSVRSVIPNYKNALSPLTFLKSQPHSISPISTTPSFKMADSTPFMSLVASRRTIYNLTNESTIPDARITELVHHTIKHVPSAFNSQTTRAVVVLKEHHQKLWDSIIDVYKTMLPEDKFQHAKGRMDGFRAAYGTILFYEDTTTLHSFQEKYKTYSDRFPGWSEQTNGMHQYVLWCALEAEGLGVNLQHYNPLIDKRIESEWGVPETWSLKAQMVMGRPVGAAGEKGFGDVGGRVRVFA